MVSDWLRTGVVFWLFLLYLAVGGLMVCGVLMWIYLKGAER